MTTSKPQIKIVDCETGEETFRDATAAEISQRQSDLDKETAAQAEAEAKATARAAILDRLGLTAEEASILLS
jgi:hypothetical protein